MCVRVCVCVYVYETRATSIMSVCVMYNDVLQLLILSALK